MECNKEEAIRAKEIAEKKMEGKDFVAARKIAQKAQQLFPDLENMSQMLAVCDIHCAAEVNFGGSEKDFYGILQVGTAADDATIKKQFRKLALLLHPDKNKYAGAEAAFKLIGEAQTVLLDPKKKWEHNMKRNAVAQTSVVKQHPPPSRKRSSTRSQDDSINNTKNAAYSPAPHQQKTFDAFWTMCPFCGIKYQYYRTILNRSLRCQNCLHPFVAQEMNVQGAAAGVNSGFQQYYHNVPLKKDFPNQGFQSERQQGDVRGSFNSGGIGVNFEAGTGSQFSGKTGPSMKAATGAESKQAENGYNNDDGLKNVAGGQTAKPSGTGNRKKGRKVEVESSESCDTSSSDDEEINMKFDNYTTHQNDEAIGSRYPRRSTRQKQQVAYREEESDDDDEDNEDAGSDDGYNDDFVNPRSPKRPKSDANWKVPMSNGDNKKSKGSKDDRDMAHEAGLPNGSKEGKKSKEHSKDEGNLKVSEAEDELDENFGGQVNSDTETAEEDKYDYPEPEFYDFDRDRTEEKFEVNQIWALYDDQDGMPRFYARLDKVVLTKFKLQFTWLEPRPTDKVEKNWCKAELPFACGTFKLGDTETCENVSMFSYLVSCCKGANRNTYRICPRKGDVWAIFKHWDIKWSSDLEKHGSYNYEVVEALSDYDESCGVEVAYLVKLKGFTSLFRRVTNDTFLIPSRELLRFSHMIPAYRLTGKEGKLVPEGSVELDPAAAPSGLEEFDLSNSFNESKAQNELSGSQDDALCSKSHCEEKVSTTWSDKPNSSFKEVKGTLPMENQGLKVYSPRKMNRTACKEMLFSR